MDWYEENVEEPLQNIVKHLRNNGVNTTCSCGHKMYIQCDYIPDGSVRDVYNLVYNYLYEKFGVVDFEMIIHLDVVGGHPYWSLNINLDRSKLSVK